MEVDTYRSVETTLPWPDRVRLTAEVGARDFAVLRRNVEFSAAGREGFAQYLDKEVAEGRDPLHSMYFVWDLLTEEGAKSGGF